MEDVLDTLRGLLPRTVTVQGEGVVEIAPDAARISAGVLVSKSDLHKARAAAAHLADAIIAAFKQAGVPDGDVRTSGYAVSPRRDFDTKGKTAPIVAYDVRNTISVVVRNLEHLPRVLDAATSAGANEVAGPNFFIQHPEALEDEARRLAMASARRRAEALATAAGGRLGPVRSIVDGQERGPAPRMVSMARMVSDAAPTPIEAGTEQIRARVEVVWELA